MPVDLSQSQALLPCGWLACKLALACALCASAFPADGTVLHAGAACAARAAFVLAAVYESAADVRALQGNAAFDALARRTVLGTNADLIRDVLVFALLQAVYRPLGAAAVAPHPAVYPAVAAWGLCAAGLTAVDVARALAAEQAEAVHIGVSARNACLAVCACAAAAAAACPAFHVALASEGLGALLCAAAGYTALAAVRLYAAGGTTAAAHAGEATSAHAPPPSCSPNAVVHGWLFFAPSPLVLGTLALANAGAVVAGAVVLSGVRPHAPLPLPKAAAKPASRPEPKPVGATRGAELTQDVLLRMREMEAAAEAGLRRAFA
jgi:hypothetical protein